MTFFQNSIVVAIVVTGLNVLVVGDGRLSAREDAVPRPRGDLLPAARDADRAGPADVHPELHPRGERLPLLQHAAGGDPSEPRERLQHLPDAPGVPRRAERPDRCGARRRGGGVAGLVADPAADRPAVDGGRRDLHVRHVVERLPVAVAHAPHADAA